MAGQKDTARQRMINLMYLVLTAMLALNVSAEVLDAFRVVRDGLDETKVSLNISVDKSMKAFDASMADNAEMTKPYYDKALIVRKESAELNDYVELLKNTLIEKAGGIDPESGDLLGRDNTDIATQLMILKTPGQPLSGQGEVLKEKINKTREVFRSLISPKDVDHVNIPLHAEDKKDMKWEVYRFEAVPATAAVTILTKIQTDVKNAEVAMVNYLLSQIKANEIVFDQLSATVIAPTSYVLVGQPYEAEVFLSASSTGQSAPEVYVSGAKAPLPVVNGKAKYTVTPNSVGEFSWGGKILLKKPDGTVTEYPFQQIYQAAAPSGIAMADKMNVLYIGVDNPITVSAAGISNDKVMASISGAGGKIKSLGKGKYIADVSTTGKATISITAKINDKVVRLGTQEYRVKQVPDPIAKFGGVASGKLSVGVARAQPGLVAALDNFDFDMKFAVVSYNGIVLKRRQDPIVTPNNGAVFAQTLKSAISSVNAGDKIIFDEIVVRDPKGKTRRLPTGITINVQ